MTGHDKMIFCTLFDSNYLDKGLALYRSMRKHIGAFSLYIFAFDDECFDVLSDMRLKNVIIVPLKEIMNETMQEIQKKRTRAEFCWTSTAVIIEYVLQSFHEKICTYIDADIYFFANPEPIIQEILDEKCSVGLVEHRFERNAIYGEKVFDYGRYCIQFNTFLNDEHGRKVLKDWKEDCLQWCYNKCENGRFGDQKYPDKWQQAYACVHVSTLLGAGVAPWNLHRYNHISRRSGSVWMKYRNKQFPILFYHFEGMKYLDAHKIYLNMWKYGKWGMNRKIYVLYSEYFAVIRSVRKQLLIVYGITFDHMLENKDWYIGKKHSLQQFCKEEGIFCGLSEWIGYRKNNFRRI